MTVARINRGLAREYAPPEAQQTNVQAQRLQTQTNEALLRVASALFMKGAPVFGLPDTSAFNGISDGITFTTGQTQDIPHNLGRPAAGFLVIDCRTNAHALIRATTGLDDQLKNTHIRLTHQGASTTLVKLWVF